MKSSVLGILLAILISGIADAAPKTSPPNASGGQTHVLVKGMRAVLAPASAPTVQSSTTSGRDQGDEHASDRAILVVCSKSTPAAQRSAICSDENVSPD